MIFKNKELLIISIFIWIVLDIITTLLCLTFFDNLTEGNYFVNIFMIHFGYFYGLIIFKLISLGLILLYNYCCIFISIKLMDIRIYNYTMILFIFLGGIVIVNNVILLILEVL
jgi:hypothetical protein